ncbi:MAG TPA: DUF1634 domain-containing protein [Vicinamibacterales bacterium]
MRDEDLLRIEQMLGRVLTWGTWLSTSTLALGLAATFVAPEWPLTRRLLTAGLVTLLLTPVARVVAAVIGYLRAREWWFVFFTGIVLALLIGSFAVAFVS